MGQDPNTLVCRMYRGGGWRLGFSTRFSKQVSTWPGCGTPVASGSRAPRFSGWLAATGLAANRARELPRQVGRRHAANGARSCELGSHAGDSRAVRRGHGTCRARNDRDPPALDQLRRVTAAAKLIRTSKGHATSHQGESRVSGARPELWLHVIDGLLPERGTTRRSVTTCSKPSCSF